MLYERGVVVQTKSRIDGLAVQLSHPAAEIEALYTSVLVAKINGGVFSMFKSSAKALSKPISLATAAMMTALFVVLYMVKIPIAPESRISVTFIPVAITGYLMGPVAAMIVGALGDIIGFLAFPSGAYFPGFTISAALSGAIYGICLYRSVPSQIRVRVIISKLLITFFINIALNTLWLAMLYNKAYFVYMTSRIIKNLIMFPFQVIIMIIVLDILNRTGITKKYF